MEKELSSLEKSTEKSTLRKQIKAELVDFISNQKLKTDAQEKVASVFLSSSLYKNTDFIFCFISTKNEISTFKILETALNDKKTILVPKVKSQNSKIDQVTFDRQTIQTDNFLLKRQNSKINKMDFFYLKNIPIKDQTEKGSFGILEPKSNLQKLEFNQIPKNALMIIPGIAFTKNGGRLGKGKGFYDIFLDELLAKSKNFCQSGIKVGICFDIQVKQKIPLEQHDKKIDFLITESGIFDCKLN